MSLMDVDEKMPDMRDKDTCVTGESVLAMRVVFPYFDFAVPTAAYNLVAVKGYTQHWARVALQSLDAVLAGFPILFDLLALKEHLFPRVVCGLERVFAVEVLALSDSPLAAIELPPQFIRLGKLLPVLHYKSW